MPADRLIHPRAGRSHKITILTDLEYRVWTQYLLSADDFGVMRATPAQLQADNDHLHNRPAKTLQRCIDALVTVGLVAKFLHQGKPYLYQPDWQRWQKVEYPRATNNPLPDDASKCDDGTRELFTKHPGGQRKDRRRPTDHPNISVRSPDALGMYSERASQMNSEDVPPTRAPAPAKRLTANGIRQEANGSEGVQGEPPLDVAFRRFQDAYPAGRRKGGLLVEQQFLAAVHNAGGISPLMDALKNHKASKQWQNPKLIPGMDTWLNLEYWRQHHEPAEQPSAQASETTDDYLERIGWCSHEPKCTDSDVCRAKRAAARNGSATAATSR